VEPQRGSPFAARKLRYLEGFVEGVGRGSHYKYFIESHQAGYSVAKADPCGFHHETPPRTASIVWPLEYAWKDAEWMAGRARRNALDSPIAIYEVHLASWMRLPEENNRTLSYREIAPKLIEHLNRTGFTHVEFMPVMEHPFSGRGAINSLATSRRRAASARLRTSCRSSTICTAQDTE